MSTECSMEPKARPSAQPSPQTSPARSLGTPDLPTNIAGFRGFDSSITLSSRGGILMSIEDFPESLTRAMLVGVMLVGSLGVAQLDSPHG